MNDLTTGDDNDEEYADIRTELMEIIEEEEKSAVRDGRGGYRDKGTVAGTIY